MLFKNKLAGVSGALAYLLRFRIAGIRSRLCRLLWCGL